MSKEERAKLIGPLMFVLFNIEFTRRFTDYALDVKAHQLDSVSDAELLSLAAKYL
jgi:hypothetical protein